jgi:hypothetical protein
MAAYYHENPSSYAGISWLKEPELLPLSADFFSMSLSLLLFLAESLRANRFVMSYCHFNLGFR